MTYTGCRAGPGASEGRTGHWHGNGKVFGRYGALIGSVVARAVAPSGALKRRARAGGLARGGEKGAGKCS